MKCPFCDSRRFSVVSRVYQDIEFDEKGKMIDSKTCDIGDIIEEEGYECLQCEKNISSDKIIRHEFHARMKNGNRNRKVDG